MSYQSPNRGVVAVELALLAPLAMVLLLGTVELGWLVTDGVVVGAAARAATRDAAVGCSTTEISDRALAVAASLDQGALVITQDYRTRDAGGQWSAWTPLGDTQCGTRTVNAAPAGAQVRVSVSYEHPLVVPGLFGCLADEAGGQVRTLAVSAVMRRE